MRRGHGFTLIELLVVVMIIALLAAMLLPAITLVRDSAKQARCASNMRQLTTIALTYSGERDGMIVHPFNHVTGAAWDRLLIELDYLSASGSGGDVRLLWCDSNPTSARWRSFTLNGQTITARRSYSMLGCHQTWNSVPIPDSAVWLCWDDNTVNGSRALSAVRSSSTTAFLREMADAHPAGINNCNNFAFEAAGVVSGSQLGMTWRYHKGSQNVAFYDGHVEAMTPQQMRGPGVSASQTPKGVWTLTVGD